MWQDYVIFHKSGSNDLLAFYNKTVKFYLKVFRLDQNQVKNRCLKSPMLFCKIDLKLLNRIKLVCYWFPLYTLYR